MVIGKCYRNYKSGLLFLLKDWLNIYQYATAEAQL